MADERRYVRVGWTDPTLDGAAETPLVDRLLGEWLAGRRRLRLIGTDGTHLEVQLLAFSADALYVADQEGYPRVVFRQHLRQIVVLDPILDGGA